MKKFISCILQTVLFVAIFFIYSYLLIFIGNFVLSILYKLPVISYMAVMADFYGWFNYTILPISVMLFLWNTMLKIFKDKIYLTPTVIFLIILIFGSIKTLQNSLEIYNLFSFDFVKCIWSCIIYCGFGFGIVAYGRMISKKEKENTGEN